MKKHFPFSSILMASLLIIMLFQSSATFAQAKDRTRFLFLLDCSGSMWGDINNKQKIVVARAILSKLVDSLKNMNRVEMALRAYGHQSPSKDCKDTKLEVPFAEDNGEQIKERLARLNPSGTTPIAYSLLQAGGDFPDRRANNIIILITDGLEECNGDPCAVSQALQAKGVILKPFIIGLGLNEDYSKQFGCVGRFFPAESEEDLSNILSSVVAQSLNNTSIEVDLIDKNGRPTETNVNMTFYNAKTGAVAYNFYHTLNTAGNPDTLIVDPFTTYNIVVHTTPQLTIPNVIPKPSRHIIVKTDAPQGYLQLDAKLEGDNSLRCLVKKAGSNEVIYVQDFNSQHRYISGTYDLEVLTLPRTRINKVSIDENKTTNISVPQPGGLALAYKRGVVASIYVMRNNKQEWVTDITANDGDPNDLYYLQPGFYKLIYRDKKSTKTVETRERDFKITSGNNVNLTLE
jgi:Ca-activated chloride channel family protein